MTREESTMMKGVAILLMLFFHLFNRMEFVELCQTTFNVGGIPLVHILTRAANPVSFFIMLSGYGLYISHKKGTYNVWRKIRMLYLHYWLTLLVFVPIGFFVVGSNKYPGDWLNIIGNVVGWNVSYNGEVWFLLPFVILMLCSGWIIKYLDKLPSWFCISVSFCISLGCGWLIPRNNVLLFHILLLAGTFALAFTLGVYMSKYQIVRKFNIGGGKIGLRENSKGVLCWIALILLVVFRCSPLGGFVHQFYVFAFIVLFMNASRGKKLDAFLLEMGKRSTSMWFVHSYFCYHLFKNFIYDFRYPIFIFAMLLICSYASARVIDWLKSKTVHY